MTMTELNSYGFYYHKSQIAIMIVQNIHFKRNWKLPVESAELEPDLSKQNEEVIDVNEYNNTLPTKYAMNFILKKFDAFSYKLIVKELIREKKGNH